MRMRLVLVLCAFFALTVGVATATAATGSGNSANAKLCQKNGWQKLFDSNGGTFASEEACVAYAAQGGMIYTTNPNPFPQSKSDCAAAGGTFSTDPSTNSLGNPGFGATGVLWTCNNTTTGVIGASQAVLDDCFTDGGVAYSEGVDTPDNTCWK